MVAEDGRKDGPCCGFGAIRKSKKRWWKYRQTTQIETGMDTFCAKLDSLFVKEGKDWIYEDYSSFDQIMRNCSVSIWD